MIVNLAQGEVLKDIFAPIRHNLHIWAIPMLLAVYWTETITRLVTAERVRNAVFNLSPSMLCVADFSGMIKIASPASGEILGYSPEEVRGRSMSEFGCNYQWEPSPSSDQENYQGKSAACYEGPYSARDGSERWLQWTIQPVSEEETLYGVVSDITEHKQAEEALRRAHAELEIRVQERTAELAQANEELRREITQRKRAEQFREEYVSLISHDLRTPLTVVLGTAQLLMKALTNRGEDRLLSGIERILDNGKRMNGMIADLVESARLEAGRVELREAPLSLQEVLQSTTDKAVPVGSQGRIDLHLEADVPLVLGDRERLERVVVNLLTNALKFSETEERVVVKLRVQDGEAVVSVADRGAGISHADLPHVFERFYRARTASKSEGLGLGLYISRLIIEAHGGRIWAESLEGTGSIFSFSLPIGDGRQG